MKAISIQRDVAIPKEHISSVYPIKVFLSKENRQTWGGSWDYWRNSAWNLSLEDAQSYCESNRVQGSHWRIIELPALILVGVKSALVCGQLTATPLSAIPDIRAETLQEAKDLVDAQLKATEVHWVLVSGGFPGPLRFPFLFHESASMGGQQRLGWSSTPRNQRVQGVLRLATQQMIFLNKETAG